MQIDWSGWSVRKYRDRLYLLDMGLPDMPAPPPAINWRPDTQLRLPDGAVLSAKQVVGEGLKVEVGEPLRVSFREGGERCKPAGRAGSNSLKNLFQEYRLEPWLRQRVPLIYCGDELAAVGDLWVCEAFAAQGDEPGYQLDWRYSYSLKEY